MLMIAETVLIKVLVQSGHVLPGVCNCDYHINRILRMDPRENINLKSKICNMFIKMNN